MLSCLHYALPQNIMIGGKSMSNEISIEQVLPDTCQILTQGGVIVGAIGAFVLEGGSPNTLIGRVVSCESQEPIPFIRIILTESFGSIPVGTLMSIDARDIAAFGPITA
ncbi:hypothetical protein HNQ80_002560 [Anaerosolibacter carboniphilus]|uniref:Uncharacterized protein n=1 Tax=Anaerosolibacter carboniphilus TaxID=1417629 RepID=A0A841KW39_9FIRM|nr:hypothetical protein [Anaerosolibacter carboniphilus]MBB6216458.1 hypothetical protein [Anaerosolibacter carboniphilus]